MYRPVFFALSIILSLLPLLSHAQDSPASTDPVMSAEEIRIRKLLNLPIPGEKEEKPKEPEKKADSPEKAELDALIAELHKTWLQTSNWFLHYAAEAGAGYQRNVLKNNTGEVDAPFASLLLEASGSYIRNRQPVFSFYAIGERREFSNGKAVPSEDFLLLFLNGSLGRTPSNRFVGEVTTFHVRQVLEDPFLQGSASLLTLWSTKIRLGFEMNSGGHSLMMGLAGSEEMYDEEVLDNFATGLFLRWKWKVRKTVRLQTEIEYLIKDYDTRSPREASGLPIDGERLGIDRFSIDFRADWNPSIQWLERLKASLKLRRDWSEMSPYDRSYWIQLKASAVFALGRFTIRPQVDGSYLDYDQRQTSLFEERRQYKGTWGTGLSVEYALTDELSVETSYDYGRNISNRESLAYDDERIDFRIRCEF